MKKLILVSLLLLSSFSYSSWWGDLDGGARAAIVTGSALLLGSQYNESEYKHQQDLRNLDRNIRRQYERQAVIENANRKYQYIQTPGYIDPQVTYVPVYQQQPRRNARVIYSDNRSQILEMPDGKRIILNQ